MNCGQRRKTCLRNVCVWGCPEEVRLYNPNRPPRFAKKKKKSLGLVCESGRNGGFHLLPNKPKVQGVNMTHKVGLHIFRTTWIMIYLCYVHICKEKMFCFDKQINLWYQDSLGFHAWTDSCHKSSIWLGASSCVETLWTRCTHASKWQVARGRQD